jgi:hypothetical protein
VRDHIATPDDIRTEYEQVNQNFRALADVRFKLLALVPAIGGVAAYLLGSLAKEDPDHPLLLAISVFGFLVTFGITFYDQRNSQLYNALVTRAEFLEEELELPPGGGGGQFRQRPGRTQRLLLLRIGHDTPGLALIYTPVLGAWFFPAVVSAATLLGYAQQQAIVAGLIAAGLAVLLFLEEFLRLDGMWRRLGKKLREAAERRDLSSR